MKFDFFSYQKRIQELSKLNELLFLNSRDQLHFHQKGICLLNFLYDLLQASYKIPGLLPYQITPYHDLTNNQDILMISLPPGGLENLQTISFPIPYLERKHSQFESWVRCWPRFKYNNNGGSVRQPLSMSLAKNPRERCMIEMFNSGMKIYQIAAHFNVGASTISGKISQIKHRTSSDYVDFHTKRREQSQAKKKLLLEMWDAGKSIDDMMNATHYSHRSITTYIREARRERDKKQGKEIDYALERRQQAVLNRKVIYDMYIKGCSIKDIMKKTAYSMRTVMAYLSEEKKKALSARENPA